MGLSIIKYPDVRLTRKSSEIAEFGEELQKLAGEMIKLCHQMNAVGLAAVQVGFPVRLLVILRSEVESEIIAIANPKVVNPTGETIDEEGCLSLPELWLNIKRPDQLTVKGKSIAGEDIELKFSGYLARGICHEIDHMDGKLIWDHLSPTERTEAIKEYLDRLELEKGS